MQNGFNHSIISGSLVLKRLLRAKTVNCYEI